MIVHISISYKMNNDLADERRSSRVGYELL
jgi:hypothetical protein